LEVAEIGGASRDRTDDLIVANDALSQLSYSPVCGWIVHCSTILAVARDSDQMAGLSSNQDTTSVSPTPWRVRTSRYRRGDSNYPLDEIWGTTSNYAKQPVMGNCFLCLRS
jgi:hypothetical protein